MDQNISESTVKRGRPRDDRARLRVLEATAVLLGEVGYERLTMEGIASRADVGKPLLYRWWPSKSAVVTDAVLHGDITVPLQGIPHGTDVWVDVSEWLLTVSAALQGPYGEVLRATTAMTATDVALASQLSEAFSRPARDQFLRRLTVAQHDCQIEPYADLEAVADLLMAVIVYAGPTRDTSRIPQALEVVRQGVEPRRR